MSTELALPPPSPMAVLPQIFLVILTIIPIVFLILSKNIKSKSLKTSFWLPLIMFGVGILFLLGRFVGVSGFDGYYLILLMGVLPIVALISLIFSIVALRNPEAKKYALWSIAYDIILVVLWILMWTNFSGM